MQVADIYDTAKRSALMARVRGDGNRATELRLITILRASSITGWRRKQPLLGRPDFVFHRERVVVFVDGCFWHGCPQHASRPSSNRAFWRKKLGRNKVRDRLVSRTLRMKGWRVLRIWQHELREQAKVARRVSSALSG